MYVRILLYSSLIVERLDRNVKEASCGSHGSTSGKIV